jgi:hypothetical protein
MAHGLQATQRKTRRFTPAGFLLLGAQQPVGLIGEADDAICVQRKVKATRGSFYVE